MRSITTWVLILLILVLLGLGAVACGGNYQPTPGGGTPGTTPTTAPSY